MSGRVGVAVQFATLPIRFPCHFSAPQLLSLGIDIRTVSGRVGHAKASTTLDFYERFLEAADERAADASVQCSVKARAARRLTKTGAVRPGLRSLE